MQDGKSTGRKAAREVKRLKVERANGPGRGFGMETKVQLDLRVKLVGLVKLDILVLPERATLDGPV